MAGTNGAPPRDRLAYLLYGNRREYHLELSYSVLSAVGRARRAGRSLDIVLVCDAGNARPDLPLTNLVVDDATMHEWRMGGRYSHLAKIHAMKHLLAMGGERLIMVDTDTVFRGDPTALFDRVGPRRALMHADEGSLQDYPSRDLWASIFAKASGVLVGIPVDLQCRMFNSGVVGMHVSDAGLVPQVIAMAVEVTAMQPVFNVEQFAFGLVLSRNGVLATCDDLVEHYWGGSRSYYHLQIEEMIARCGPGGIASLADSLPALRAQPPVRRLDRIAASVCRRLRGWSAEYGYAWLACRSAFAAKDPRLANVWADAAIAMLTFGRCGDLSHAGRDFARMRPDRLDGYRWMSADTRQRWRRFWETQAGPVGALPSRSGGKV